MAIKRLMPERTALFGRGGCALYLYVLGPSLDDEDKGLMGGWGNQGQTKGARDPNIYTVDQI